MSVTSTQTRVAYTSDGVTAAYAVPFYFFAFTDLLIQITTGGVVTTSPINSGWLGSGTPDSFGAYPNGGTITFQPGQIPANGATITIIRNTALQQSTTFPDNSPFSGNVLEHALDRLTLIAQEKLSASGFVGLLAGPPTVGNYVVGQWFIVVPPVAGGPWGFVCTAAGAPGTWEPFASISL